MVNCGLCGPSAYVLLLKVREIFPQELCVDSLIRADPPRTHDRTLRVRK